jgi:cysteine sulfinate desulfinase/cysteine desulfurase-like protein
LALAEICRVHQVRFDADASQWLVKVDVTSPAHFDFQQMRAAFPELCIISGNAPRLWNAVFMVMPEHSNLKWLTRLSRLGFAISTNSASGHTASNGSTAPAG